MRIAVFAPFFPPDPTGSSIFAEQQVAELARQGHEILVITNRADKTAPSRVSKEHRSVDVRRVRAARLNLGQVTWNYRIPFSFFGFILSRQARAIRKFNPDAIIVHSTLFDLSLLGLVCAWRRRVPTIIVSHTALWHDQKIVNRAMRFYGKSLLRALIRLANAFVICVDKWTYDNALELFTKPENCHTVPVLTDYESVQGGQAEVVLQRFPEISGPILLSLGHVVPLRDRLNLTRALPLILQQHPTLSVVVVGMVKDPRFLALAEQLGVHDRFVIAGAVPHNEIRNYLASASIEMHDLDGRGLGITSVEAMAAGVPIVAWAIDNNYPGVSLRSFGVSGFIEDGEPESIAAKVCLILEDEHTRQEVIDTQRKIVDTVYSARSITNQYLAILTK
jgi:glycosyltransferase involved in cell wall biosynthesis